MRKFIKASIIFSIIVNPLMIILSVLTYVLLNTPLFLLIVSAVYGLTSVGVGVWALNRFNEAKHKKELKATAIITLIFNNPLAGVLMLIMKDF